MIRQLIAADAPWPLVLLGPAGIGKTCTALCLLDFAGGAYYVCDQLVGLFGQAKRGELDWYQEGRGGKLRPDDLWSGIKRQPLIVLDELGTREGVSDHHYDTVKTLLDTRENSPLVVISNLSVGRLMQLYDSRVTSRLACGTVLEGEGADRRLPGNPPNGE